MKEVELTLSNRQMIIDNVDYGIQAGGKAVKFSNATSRRTLEQNKKVHAMLADISRQIEHHGQTTRWMFGSDYASLLGLESEKSSR